MVYTNKALVVVWLLVLGLFVLAGSGVVAGPWLLLLVAAALVVPAIVLTLFPRPAIVVGAITATYAGALVAPAQKGPPRAPITGDIARWGNDGGAAHVFTGPRAPILVAPAASLAAAPPIERQTGFRLRATVRQGTAASLPAVWERYPTVDAARAEVRSMYAHDRVSRVLIVTDDVPPRFVEWVDR